MSGTGTMRGTSSQDFLVGGEATAMDSERCLRCLSLKPALKFATMSSSSSASQIIQSTIGSTSVFGSVLAESESAIESCVVLAAKENVEAKVGGDSSGEDDTF
ncbi:hypothetical protein PVL29_012027 [Vitis rotundifolia]|uniref:Uncharacterized protein n=1 Tax=Vitis rotundifolia TaxID=103349 RepID=A0AA39DQ73_VITRO|nr:hypothetical protein PVL29_012027 [Vitis rotundifolia]